MNEPSIGRTVGRYQIIEEIGRGGMAVVYKAWQPSLERYVALKVLPGYYQHDPVFLARFQREARAAAGLSHPNIVTIYDVGEHDGMHYITMEYLEGGSLRDRIAQGALRLDEARRITDQVAGALDYAHARKLIHRDIKPGNILFTADGRPKVADFGIARPTEETRLTQTGLMMGTPDYMAPEQATGGAVDYRADLYALGVVLYQMVTGQLPFRRTTPHATLHAVIYEPPPPPREVNPALPVAVEQVIFKALAKQPGERYQRGADLAAALRGAVEGKAVVAAAPRVRRVAPLAFLLAGGAIVITVLLAFALIQLLNGGNESTPAAPSTLTRVVEVSDTPSGGSLPATAAPNVTVVTPVPPDRPTDTPTPTDALEPDETPPPDPPTPSDTPTVIPTDTHTPTPSATSTATATDEPPPTAVPPTTAPSPYFGRLAFSSNRQGNPEIYVIDLSGGSPTRLTNTAGNEWLPDWAPGGGKIAFTSNRSGGYDLWSMNANGNNQNSLVQTGAWDEYASWAPDGQRLAFSSTAVTQNVSNSEIFVRLADGTLVQRTHSTFENQNPDWAPDGRIIYSEGTKGTSNWNLWIMNGDGSNAFVWRGGTECEVQPSWSPDGAWITFLRPSRDTNGNGVIDEGDAGDIWVSKVGGGSLRQLTSSIWAVSPAWSPDSRWVAFTQLRDTNSNGVSDQNDAADILAVPRGGGDIVPLVTGSSRDGDPSWTQ